MTTIVGIDPGLSGAIVAITEQGAVILATRAPLFRGVFDVAEAARILRELPRPILGAIEKASPRGRSGGGRGTFDTGYLSVCANIRAWQAAAGFRLDVVHARTWQAAVLGKVVDSKAQSIAWCQAFAADVDLRPGRCTTDQDGIADARCIAEWVRRRLLAPIVVKASKCRKTPHSASTSPVGCETILGRRGGKGPGVGRTGP